jgi:hypothetical protein
MQPLSKALPFAPAHVCLSQDPNEQIATDIPFVGLGIRSVISPFVMNWCLPPE